ncbi:ChbG/HpnK family deacetylase [Luteitalea sp.]|uniref:carbohydrate deacetylase n=1 Tax=Luteitalea sp. TaxID=2004800 RepID=UPI000B2B012E|nr:ChbG/HpnK family deacetylase [Luteitalea sp.]
MRLLALLPLAIALLTQTPATEIRLIVKGDDMAAGHGINVATIDAYTRGVLTTTNVIVPGPWFPEAVRLLQANPGLDVGVHLTMTSEWENVKWRPLTHAPSLVDRDGYFFPLVSPRQGYPAGTSLRESKWTLDEMERELRAQLDLAKRHLPRITYTWNHMGFASVSPEATALVARLSKEYGLIVPSDLGIQSVGRVYESRDTGAVKAEKLARRLESLTPGLWLHIDHAATNDPEMQAFGHAGYEWVAADRSANLEAWTSPMVREVITRKGIRLVGYRDLK